MSMVRKGYCRTGVRFPPPPPLWGRSGFDGDIWPGLHAGWRGHVTDTQTKTATNRDSNKVIPFPMHMSPASEMALAA